MFGFGVGCTSPCTPWVLSQLTIPTGIHRVAGGHHRNLPLALILDVSHNNVLRVFRFKTGGLSSTRFKPVAVTRVALLGEVSLKPCVKFCLCIICIYLVSL